MLYYRILYYIIIYYILYYGVEIYARVICDISYFYEIYARCYFLIYVYARDVGVKITIELRYMRCLLRLAAIDIIGVGTFVHIIVAALPFSGGNLRYVLPCIIFV